MEEIGTKVEVIGEIGKVVEYRCGWKMKQISYCYLAKTKGKKGKSEFTEEEINDGFELLWLPFEKAFEKISDIKSKIPEATDFVVPRDTLILEKSKDIMFSDI